MSGLNRDQLVQLGGILQRAIAGEHALLSAERDATFLDVVFDLTDTDLAVLKNAGLTVDE